MSRQIERIKDLENRHRLISDNLIDAMWVMDIETYRFEYMTDSIEKISGYRPEEYLSMSVIERLSQESYEKIQMILAEEVPKFKKGIKNIRKFEIELIHKTKSLYWIEIRTRLFREDGRLKILGVSRDITDQKKEEQEKDRLIDRLGKVLAEKNRLLKENKILKALLPICSGCKRIRDENDKWWPWEAYARQKAKIDLTHTICPDCRDIFYGKPE